MRWLGVLRGVAVLHAVAMCVQPIVIGIYLNGATTGLKVHEPVGLAVSFIGIAQLLVALVHWRLGGRGVAALVSALILFGESVQIGMGYSKQLAIHIPLGVALIGTSVCFAAWICRRTVRTAVPA
ncbi:hypothetical protein [Kribbella albertanoniae]|uniref:Uncharacterized protein n=1 Tax=Kribbella albertanoniae TaxID=1266829 RepID=A0A4R4QBC5_9ACTN|nr:hypothetical protein [Kribbella albertanoniae]TDC32610.1 hypothetical protein E1261_08195 [Kribbella albertanoniae]